MIEKLEEAEVKKILHGIDLQIFADDGDNEDEQDNLDEQDADNDNDKNDSEKKNSKAENP